MASYIIRKRSSRAWQVVRADRARRIACNEPSEEEAERMYNRAATVTLKSRKAASEFIESIGGTWEQ